MGQTIEQFLNDCGMNDYHRDALPSDASRRRYERLSLDHQAYMLMDSREELDSYAKFMEVQSVLEEAGFSVPKIHQRDDASGLAVLEDFGSDSFTKKLAVSPQDEMMLYEAATDVLIKLHGLKNNNLPTANEQYFMERVQLMPAWYMQDLEKDAQIEFTHIWKDILTHLDVSHQAVTLVDYHVDNLMWLSNRQGQARCGLLDFQDALRMPVGYDIMSLLLDDRRNVTKAVQEKLLDKFIRETNVDKDSFMVNYYILATQRHTKNIGIFARLMKRDQKMHYGDHIPRLLDYINVETQQLDCLQPLNEWFKKHGKIS